MTDKVEQLYQVLAHIDALADEAAGLIAPPRRPHSPAGLRAGGPVDAGERATVDRRPIIDPAGRLHAGGLHLGRARIELKRACLAFARIRRHPLNRPAALGCRR